MLNQNIFKTKLKKIKEFVVPIDKLSSVIFDTDKEGIEGIVENRHLDILTPFSLKLLKDNNGNDIPLDPIDKLIILVAISEQLAGNDVITFSRLFHDIGGGDKLTHAPVIQAVLIDRISKLRRTEISVDLTALLAKFKNYAETLGVNPNPNGKIILTGALLPSETITAVINGRIIEGAIHFLSSPVIFTIASMKNQIARFNPNLLDVPIKTTEQTLKLKFYLLERILKIKGSNDPKRNKRVRKLNNSILFETIYRQCGLSDAEEWQKQDARKNIVQILDHFVSQNFIKNYEIVKQDATFYSISIIF